MKHSEKTRTPGPSNRVLLSYVVKYAGGFAPNPFGGFLTLATCKPRIRKSAKKGDWLVGTGSKATVGNEKLIYAAEVSDVIPISEYGRAARYRAKRPSDRGWKKFGDNLYFFKNDEWHQRENQSHGPDGMEKDLSGLNVLVCEKFWYFGKNAVPIPLELRGVIKKGPGHKKISDQNITSFFINWLERFPCGIFKESSSQNKQDTSNKCDRTVKRITSSKVRREK